MVESSEKILQDVVNKYIYTYKNTCRYSIYWCSDIRMTVLIYSTIAGFILRRNLLIES